MNGQGRSNALPAQRTFYDLCIMHTAPNPAQVSEHPGVHYGDELVKIKPSIHSRHCEN
jgi:hypothetical protein